MSKNREHLFLCLEVFLQEGGIQSYLQDVFRAYSKLNYQGEVWVLRDKFTTQNHHSFDDLTFRCFAHQSPLIGRLNFTMALLQYLIFQRPSHVYCTHIKLANLTRLLCNTLQIPYTVLTYGKEVWEKVSINERQALQEAQAIWTISNYSARLTALHNQLHTDKFRLLPCVVDQEKFTIQPKPAQLLAKYQLTNQRVLLTVARLWATDIYKGVDVTIRALPQILAVFPDVVYLVVGRGNDQPRLDQLAKDLGVEKQVIFAGFIPNDELVAHYQVCDAYIMPSQEGFGIVYLEAMCCGKPVLSGNDDGSSDPLQDGRLGWQVPHRNVDAVAQGCLEILRGSDARCDGRFLRDETIKKFSQTSLPQRLQALIIKK